MLLENIINIIIATNLIQVNISFYLVTLIIKENYKFGVEKIKLMYDHFFYWI